VTRGHTASVDGGLEPTAERGSRQWRADAGEGSDADPLRPADRQQELVDLTLEVWQPLSSRQLSDEDAREILANVTGFFGALAKWDRGLRQSDRSEAA
jgi:hypothetical protein